MLLKPHQRTKLDPTEDRLFYSFPRFVTHVDDGFIQRLQQLYRDRLQPGTRILDLMSSWVSHLPEDIQFEQVTGHGLNAEELAKNPRLDQAFVQDLNREPKLPLADQCLDAVLIAVSIQYLQYPEAVLSEVYRILKPGGVVIISFSNRMFYEKAIQAWRDSSEGDRLQLVRRYFEDIEGFTAPEVVMHKPAVAKVMSWFNLTNTDPFYAVLAYRCRTSKTESINLQRANQGAAIVASH